MSELPGAARKGGPRDPLAAAAGDTALGSYTKPTWLLDKSTIGAERWSAAPDVLADAQDDTVRLAVYDQERAGLDLLSDGEGRRLNFARHFSTR